MKSRFISTLFLIIFVADGLAQKDQLTSNKFAIKTQFGESLLNELNIGIEKSITPLLSLEVNVGWIRALNFHTKCFFLGFDVLKLPLVSSGAVFWVSANYNLPEPVRFPNSLSFTLLYKNVSAKDVEYDPGCFSGDHSGVYELFSQNTRDYGVQILANKTLINPERKLILDFYCGLGLRMREVRKEYQLEGTWFDKKVSNKIDHTRNILPSIHIGIKTGLNFAKKSR